VGEFARDVVEQQDQNAGSSARASAQIFMKDSLLRSLKFHLCPESKDNSASRASADIRVVLNDGLKKQHGSEVE